ncbi:MAG: hypothetical protein OXN89_25920 [Bryobacterales bacterium]|nr:hypothetical protein [Bryobacterales bacterium]
MRRPDQKPVTRQLERARKTAELRRNYDQLRPKVKPEADRMALQMRKHTNDALGQ